MKGLIPVLLNQNQISTIENIVKDACFSSTNKFGESIWQYHILPVKKHGILLANELSADKEIVELACLLHDYSGKKDKGVPNRGRMLLYNCKFFQDISKNYGIGLL